MYNLVRSARRNYQVKRRLQCKVTELQDTRAWERTTIAINPRDNLNRTTGYKKPNRSVDERTMFHIFFTITRDYSSSLACANPSVCRAAIVIAKNFITTSRRREGNAFMRSKNRIAVYVSRNEKVLVEATFCAFPAITFDFLTQITILTSRYSK